MTKTCTNCEQPTATLTACEGQRLCPPCTTVYLTEAAQEFNARYFGEQYRYATGADLPVYVGGRPR